jgi:hypothetical protein
VVRGFEVTLVADGSGGKLPVVAVTRGLAFNRNGQAAALPLDVQVALTREIAPLPVDAGLFADCPPPSSTVVPLQAGLYVLTVTPASGFSGKAPMYSFGDVNTATGCGSRYAVEGVFFNLVSLDVGSLLKLSQATRDDVAALMQKTDAPSLSLLRNRVAHVCFGTEEVAGFLAAPFAPANGPSPFVGYGAIDALIASGGLTPGDVPLALLYWTVAGLQFLDMWSVRRRPVQQAPSTSWPLAFSARRRIEAEAAFLQFEDQVQALLASGSGVVPANVHAADCFRYLPAAAILPVAGNTFGGFTTAAFFAGKPHRDPEFIDGKTLGGLLDGSLDYPPIDATDAELVWVYRDWQNAKAIDDGTTLQPFIVFASGQMPHVTLARFDVARWDYANYAI